jgi:hypothetical protein
MGKEKTGADAVGGEPQTKGQASRDGQGPAASQSGDGREDAAYQVAALQARLDEIAEEASEQKGQFNEVLAKLEALATTIAKKETAKEKPAPLTDEERIARLRATAERIEGSQQPYFELLRFLDEAERTRDTALLAEVRKLSARIADPKELEERINRIERDAQIGKGTGILMKFMEDHPALGDPRNEVMRKEFFELLKKPGMTADEAMAYATYAQMASDRDKIVKDIPEARLEDFNEQVDQARNRILAQEKLRSESLERPTPEFLEQGIAGMQRELDRRAGRPVPSTIGSGKPRLEPLNR